MRAWVMASSACVVCAEGKNCGLRCNCSTVAVVETTDGVVCSADEGVGSAAHGTQFVEYVWRGIGNANAHARGINASSEKQSHWFGV